MPIQASNDEPLFILDQQIRGEELIVGTLEWGDRLVRSTFEQCILTVVNPKATQLGRCRFVDCIIRPKKKVQVHWDDNAWENCTFYGHYVSMSFGTPSIAHTPSPWGDLAIRGCDFSNAKLHWCWFKRTDVASMKFPKWPCFTVLHPQRNKAELMALPLPVPAWERTGWIAEDDTYDVMVFHWPSIVKMHEKRLKDHPQVTKRDVIDADPEEVKRVLASADFVLV